jgi:hypothetical protein
MECLFLSLIILTLQKELLLAVDFETLKIFVYAFKYTHKGHTGIWVLVVMCSVFTGVESHNACCSAV